MKIAKHVNPNAVAAYLWILPIIQSCKNSFHFESVDKLIDLYVSQFGDDDSATSLRTARQNKYIEVHDILID